MNTYVPLTPLVEPYLTVPLANLPDNVRRHVEKMPHNLWDHISPEQRRRYARDYDYQNDQGFEIERIAGWLEAVYDAPTWWLAESVTAQHAAMLLSGHNPISETLEGA
ncbi:MAG: hypothetical protein K2X55_13230, partial [Burkholderiaceae bacterium]|nr:hypothetical protein [Burkholderiaceae bacterium]